MFRKQTLKRSLHRLYLAIPDPLSKFIYRMARATIYKDRRNPFFEKVFTWIHDQKVEGDYLEFGVYQGTSFIMSMDFAKSKSMDKMRFVAFDSFEGLPESEGQVYQKGDFVAPEPFFKQMIQKAGHDVNVVTIVKGMYDQSLTPQLKKDANITKAAIVHVDCDLYVSTKTVLEFIEDIVVDGTVIIFDDWLDCKYDGKEVGQFGESKAFMEWVLYPKFREFYDTMTFGKAFVLDMNSPENIAKSV